MNHLHYKDAVGLFGTPTQQSPSLKFRMIEAATTTAGHMAVL